MLIQEVIQRVEALRLSSKQKRMPSAKRTIVVTGHWSNIPGVPYGSTFYTTGKKCQPPMKPALYQSVSTVSLSNISCHFSPFPPIGPYPLKYIIPPAQKPPWSGAEGRDSRQVIVISSGLSPGRTGKNMACINCGKFRHRAWECKLRQVKPFCVRCRKCGHTSGQCSRQKYPRPPQQGRRSLLMTTKGKYFSHYLRKIGPQGRSVLCKNRKEDPYPVVKGLHDRIEKTISGSTRIERERVRQRKRTVTVQFQESDLKASRYQVRSQRGKDQGTVRIIRRLPSLPSAVAKHRNGTI